jgi:hypothetical protein
MQDSCMERLLEFLPPNAPRMQGGNMTACNCKRWASFVVLCLAAASWAIALGGLGAITWAACTDTQATRTDVASTEGAAAGSLFAALGVPPANTDTAVCARSWRWEWW